MIIYDRQSETDFGAGRLTIVYDDIRGACATRSRRKPHQVDRG